MSTRKQDKVVQNLFQQIWQLSKTNPKQQMQWLLRGLLVSGRQQRFYEAGFVLPTVAMVSLVIVLLTTAMMFRAFDRSKYASNVRVNEAVMNAATPALDRAKAKLDALFSDPALPRATPSDIALNSALRNIRYKLGDETQLKLVHDIDGNRTIQKSSVLENDETLNTAWKFPVDTDNDGKFDSYTLYSILLRSPSRKNDVEGQFDRARNPLEVRTPPMEGGNIGRRCADANETSANLIGDSDWYKSGAKLTKSFFVYTATVPIVNPPDTTNYEAYKGNKGFSALEFQQDRGRIPLNNNAAWYEDDIEISNASTVRLNGRVFTNSNLLVAGNTSSNKTIFYQVSDPDSCYYEQENSKITVGGNVGNGNIELTSDAGNVEVHTFQGKATAPGSQDTANGINDTNKTTTESGGRLVGYNNRAYSERIGVMVQAALNLHPATAPTETSVRGIARYPLEVKERFAQRISDSSETKEPRRILTEELETYFKVRTRRVPNAEDSSIGAGAGLGGYTAATVLGATSPIRPPDAWMAIESPTSGSVSGYTNLALNFPSSNLMNLKATEPKEQEEKGKEFFIGDRILVGNNLPSLWAKFTPAGVFERFANLGEPQNVKNGINNVFWSNSSGSASGVQRTRQSQLQLLPDLGSVDRDGFWETEASKQPAAYENSGGLRVVTGSGIYIDGVTTGVRGTNSFLPAPSPNVNVVWSDLMPMWNGSTKGDLQMRATAVYHYKQGSAATTGAVDPKQLPIACVSSYYDPTNSTTARNATGLPDVSATYDTNGDGTFDKLADGSNFVARTSGHQSNNGVAYEAPYTTTPRTTAVSAYRTKLDGQARLVFPTGRIVNEPLRKALAKIDANPSNPDLSLADSAAIDTTICGLKILDGTLTASDAKVPHGAIKEATFLDARQVKSLNNLGSDNTKIAERDQDLTDRYTLPLEQRQPLEIRVTELDMRLLKNKAIGTGANTSNDENNTEEYLLPNSGIIYATRDDALPDLSYINPDLIDSNTDKNTEALVSPTDFKLDSTRRPNGIRLINGSNIARKNFFRVVEKGLILATNLPTYIKGDFNLHKDPGSNTVREEFTDTLEANWSDFYTRTNTLDKDFACRQNQPGCEGTGDQWRPATIISDAQALLSNNFWDGFRNQGDYDLNNNHGNSAVNARLKNGFWNNSFVTSADWAGSDGYPDYKNSYLTNGVTPIQRRVNFPEYVMEICRKVPVSQCQPGDWVVGYDSNGDGDIEDSGEKDVKASALPTNAAVARLGAGTTARAALQAGDRHYPRRVAFKRKTSNNALLLSDWASGQVTPIPYGINSSDQVAEFPYTSTNVPKSVDKALWFRTTTNTDGRPFCNGNNNPAGSGCTSDQRSYAKDKPLYYDGSTKLVSPPTPEIPGVSSLNLPANNPASEYTICTKNDGSTKKSSITSTTTLEGDNCGSEAGNPLAAMEATYDDLIALNPNSSLLDEIVAPLQVGILTAGTTTTYTQTGLGRVNVIDLGGSNQTIGTSNTASTVIKLVGNADSVFVFKKSGGSLDFADNASCGSPCNRRGVVVELDGVDPNNIFWALNSAPQWNEVNASYPHEMKGTFISKGTAAPSLMNVNIEGRLLAFNGLPVSGKFTGSKVSAIASTGQPYLVPVLQIHSPTGTPGSSPFAGLLTDNWVQQATTITTANAAFITGDSPSRPNPAETNGGLPNFIRFLENWNGDTARISGSFIQFKRSAYGSAPFYPVDPTLLDSSGSLFYNLDADNEPAYLNGTGYTGFRYRGGVFAYRASYYYPPTRAYGYDVALLSQSPDLFAQRFTTNTTTSPSEFFREVGQDDAWVRNLLCAAQGSGSSYSYAVDANRPSDCPALTSYND